VRDFQAHGHGFFGADSGGAIVGGGRIRATALQGFLGGAAVALEQRGRGVYRALVQVRVNWALDRGAPFVGVHAREASARVLRDLGFETVATLRTLQRGR
jgi:GNAT superfamily N-acetyltransferase